jgi:hypothetical protein
MVNESFIHDTDDSSSTTNNVDGDSKMVGIEPLLLIGTIAILLIYYFMFGSLGNNENGSASPLKMIIGYILWIMFVALILLNGLMYIFGIDIMTTLKKMLGITTDEEVSAEVKEENKLSLPTLKLIKEVFHIPGNKYTYEDSKAICNAYGGRLANYNEVSSAFDKGADWCSYGWSDGQMALFPTQEEKWKKLQKDPGHENDCGRPGINGGYIENPALKYGVNCYGNKPPISANEAEIMRNSPIHQKTMKEVRFDKQVEHWRKKLCDIVIAPFNHNNWSVL